MAGRPRKDAQLAFYDEFYSMPLVEQEIALRILQEHHRVESRRQKPKIEPAADKAETAEAST